MVVGDGKRVMRLKDKRFDELGSGRWEMGDKTYKYKWFDELGSSGVGVLT
jgi:hypothetical protein